MVSLKEFLNQGNNHDDAGNLEQEKEVNRTFVISIVYILLFILSSFYFLYMQGGYRFLEEFMTRL